MTRIYIPENTYEISEGYHELDELLEMLKDINRQCCDDTYTWREKDRLKEQHDFICVMIEE